MHFKKSSVHHSWTPETSKSNLWTLVGGQMHKDAAGTAPQQLHASHCRNCQQKKQELAPGNRDTNCLFGAREKFPYFDLECSFVSLLGAGQNLNPCLSLVAF